MEEREHAVVAPRKEEIRSRVDRIRNWPTLPGIGAALREIMAESETTAGDIAQLVSKDPALSANFLKLVNAPFYGFPGRIASIQHAMMLAGSNVVEAVASNTTVCNVAGAQGAGLWQHCLGVALTSRLLAERLKVPDVDEVMAAGLLHDLGKVVLHALFADEAERVYRLAAEREMLIVEAERELLGVDHAEIGRWVAESWNFPAGLKSPIAYHHDPALSKNGTMKTAIVHFADILVRSLDFGNAGDNRVPCLHKEAWNMLGLSEENLREVVDDVDNELSVTGTALFRDA